MRNPTASLAAGLIAALVIATAALAQTPGPLSACAGFDPAQPRESLVPIGIAVIGSVQDAVEGKSATLAPEAYLKGPTSAGTVRLRIETLPGECEAGSLRTGDRVLLLLQSNQGDVHWPSPEQTWVLRGGEATLQATGETMTEGNLISSIRDITGQYSIPAESEAEAPGIDWIRTVLWVGGVVLAVFAVGLVMMKEWHRIDPT